MGLGFGTVNVAFVKQLHILRFPESYLIGWYALFTMNQDSESLLSSHACRLRFIAADEQRGHESTKRPKTFNRDGSHRMQKHSLFRTEHAFAMNQDSGSLLSSHMCRLLRFMAAEERGHDSTKRPKTLQQR